MNGPAAENPRDALWMREALVQAQRAAKTDEVPVGAVLVCHGEIVASAFNRTLLDCDPTAHAEILVLREAARKAGNHRLTDASLYVTLEPCAMCMGAMIQARIRRLVYAASDPKAGAAHSLYRLAEDTRLNHRFAVTPGVEAEPAARLLHRFFRKRRGS